MGWEDSGRGRARLLAALGALVALLVSVPAPASAHTDLVSSNPAHESVMDFVPDHVVLEFDEPVGIDNDSVQVIGPDGDDRAIGVLGSDTGRLVSVAMDPNEKEGSWQVRYRVLGVDGHVVSGRLDFAVGESSPPLGGLEISPLAASALVVLLAAGGYLLMAPRLARDLEGVR